MTTGRKGLQQAQAAGDDGDMPTSLTGAAGAIKIDPSTEEAGDVEWRFDELGDSVQRI